MQLLGSVRALSALVVALALAGTAVAQYAPASEKAAPTPDQTQRPPDAPAPDAPAPDAPAPGGPVNAAAPQPAADGPTPVALVDAIDHDFGDIWADQDLQHSFKITNTGQAPLKITKVKPACGCTVAGKYPNEIAVGESGLFPFRLNTSRVHGKFTKTIAITTNDPKNEQIRLSLTGTVKHHIEMNPQIAQFGRVSADSVLTRKIKIQNNTETPLELTVDQNADLGCFKADLEEVKPGQEFDLIITAQPPFKTGINRTTVNLTSNVPTQKQLSVVCMATMPQRLEMQPDRIQLIPSAATQTPRRITLTNNGPTPVNIVSATATDEQIQVEPKADEPGKRYQIMVTFPANYQPASTDTAIVLKTDDAESPELKIPVQMIDRRAPQQPQQRPATTLLGKPAPEVTAKTAFDDAEVQIGGKGEQVQFLVFYASWCGFCKRALPKIEELEQKYKDNHGVKIVAINLDDRSGPRARTEEQSLQHYKDMKLTMPMVMDAEKKIGPEYKVTSFPTMFVVGKSGEIEAVHVGAAAGFENTVAQEIDLLVAGKTRADFPSAAATPQLPKPAAAATRQQEENRLSRGGEIPVTRATLRQEKPPAAEGAAPTEEKPSDPPGN